MSHHPLTISGGLKRGVLKISRGWIQEVFLTYFSPRPLPYHFFFVLGSAFVRLNLLLYQTTEKKKRSRQKTASYALVELYKLFNSLSFSVAPDENSDRQQQNSGRDTKWNVNNFVNDSGIFWCRCGSRGWSWFNDSGFCFYDHKQNKYIRLWSKVLYYKWKWGSFFQ